MGVYLYFALLLFVVLFSYLILGCYLWYRIHQRIDIHIPSVDIKPKEYALEVIEQMIHTSDNVNLSSWVIPCPHPNGGIVLIHGYGYPRGGKGHMLIHAKYLRSLGYTTLLLDLRSFGKSEGHRVTFGIHEWKDVVAGVEFLKKSEPLLHKKVGVFGISMGAASCIIAQGKSVCADYVIASVPYSTFDSIFTYQAKLQGLPLWVSTPIVRCVASLQLGPNYAQFSPKRFIQSIHVPILIMAAKHDQQVDPRGTEELATLAHQPKVIWRVDAKHDIHLSLPDAFEEQIKDFLRRFG